MSKRDRKVKTPKTPEQIKKGKKRKKIILVVCAVVVIGGVAVTKMMPKQDAVPVVSVAAVKNGDITSVLDTSGTVISLKTKTYFSPVNANIREYNGKVGQVVKTGDMLVSFQTDTLEKDNRKAELTASTTINGNKDTVERNQKTLDEAAVASQNVAILENDINNYKNYISDLNAAINNRTQQLADEAYNDAVNSASNQSGELAKLNQALVPAAQRETLLSANSDLQAEIDQLSVQKSQAEFENDEATADILESQIEEKEKQIKENKKKIENLEKELGDYAEVSAEEIQNQITALSSASANYTSASDASADVQIAQWQLDMQNAQETLAQLQSDLAEEKAKVSAGDVAVMTEAGKKVMDSSNNMAELESASVEELLEKGRKGIHAEFDGIVTKADLTEGTPATQGLELVTVSSNREVAVRATVSKYDFGKLKEGQKATVTIGNNEYKATVDSISKVAQTNEKGSPVITCEVKLDNPDDNVFLGVEAKVAIITAEEKGVLTIPTESVNTGKDGTFCYTLQDGVVTKCDVKTGVNSADETEVLSGLKEGDTVIEELPEGVEEGSEVRAEE